MTWTPTTITIKDANGTTQPLVAYTDGTNFSFAHPLLDNTGAAVSPATSGKQDVGNTSLATIAAAASLSSTSALQTSGNTILSAIQAQLAGTVSVAVTGTPALAAGASTAALQTAGNASLSNIDADLGAKADTAATTDTGTFSLIALFKRGLQTLASIAANTTGAATSAKQDTGNAALSSLVAVGPTAALQTTGNTSLATIATNTAGAATAANQATEIGTLSSILTATQAATPAGTNLIGSVSMSANTASGTSTFAATGGTGNALLTNAAVAVKASAGNLYGVSLVNTGAAAAYVQMFDALTGSVTLGTTAPKLSFWVPAGGSWEEKFTGEAKVSFASAITVAAASAPTGGAAPATGILANIVYK